MKKRSNNSSFILPYGPDSLIDKPMSVTQTTENTTTNLSPKAQKLAQYLHDEASNNGGEMYIKSKFISDDVGLSSKEIGALMVRLQEHANNLTVEKWSYTSATTWLVTSLHD